MVNELSLQLLADKIVNTFLFVVGGISFNYRSGYTMLIVADGLTILVQVLSLTQSIQVFMRSVIALSCVNIPSI